MTGSITGLSVTVTASVLFGAAVSARGVSNAGRFEYLEGLDYATVAYGG